jgi:two-component system sensor histidine kinase KdpD
MDNAIKHTIPSDEIKVSVRTNDNKAWFEVSDNGTGINPKDIPNLFDMFFVAPNSYIDAKHGIGLGLSICKAIVNFHGGEIFAENNRGKGSTFRFYLNI